MTWAGCTRKFYNAWNNAPPAQHRAPTTRAVVPYRSTERHWYTRGVCVWGGRGGVGKGGQPSERPEHPARGGTDRGAAAAARHPGRPAAAPDCGAATLCSPRSGCAAAAPATPPRGTGRPLPPARPASSHQGTFFAAAGHPTASHRHTFTAAASSASTTADLCLHACLCSDPSCTVGGRELPSRESSHSRENSRAMGPATAAADACGITWMLQPPSWACRSPGGRRQERMRISKGGPPWQASHSRHRSAPRALLHARPEPLFAQDAHGRHRL